MKGSVSLVRLDNPIHVLVGVFLVAFMLYYFVNWKVLSAIWRIG